MHQPQCVGSIRRDQHYTFAICHLQFSIGMRPNRAGAFAGAMPRRDNAAMSEAPAPPPLMYATPEQRRPALITAIGVFSVVIGSLGILSICCGGLDTSLVSWAMMASSGAPAATAPATTVSITSPMTSVSVVTYAGPFGSGSMPPAYMGLLAAWGIDYLLSTGLSVYLLVIGILTLRHSPRGLTYHQIYVWIKLPLALIGTVAWIFFARALMQMMAAGGAAPPAWRPVMVAFAVVRSFLLLIYPVALLFVLRSPTVRSYYGQIRT